MDRPSPCRSPELERLLEKDPKVKAYFVAVDPHRVDPNVILCVCGVHGSAIGMIYAHPFIGTLAGITVGVLISVLALREELKHHTHSPS